MLPWTALACREHFLKTEEQGLGQGWLEEGAFSFIPRAEAMTAM